MNNPVRNQVSQNQEIEEILSQMSLEQKVGQCIVIGMSGTVITNDLREAIVRYQCSGVRLSPFLRIFRYFSDDKARKQEVGADFVPSMQKMAKQGLPPYRTPEQFAQTLNDLQTLAATRKPAIPLHFVIDQEGDTSKDLSRGGLVQFPSSMGLVMSGDKSLTERVARAVAKQMLASGIHWVHSPVVDVNINPQNPEIGRRSFSDDPEIVAEFAKAMVKGFQEEGVIGAAKHFPGRGDSATDAHHACPTLNVDSERFNAVELHPYKKLIEAGIKSIMVAHCIYPHLDPDQISTVSRKVVHDLLRDELGFKGIITTDSITMGALIDRYGIGEACARSLAAGADIILMKAENQWRGEMFYTIQKWVEEGKIDSKELDDKVRRILKMKMDLGLFDNMGQVDASKAALPYKDPEIINLAKEASQSAIMVCKDELGALPLDKSKKVLLINQLNQIKTPNDSWDHPSLLSEIMEAEWPELEVLETDFGSNEADTDVVMKTVEKGNYDLILVTSFYDRSKQPHAYTRKLIEAGYPVLLITNTPYYIKEQGGLIPHAKSIILNANLTPEGLRTINEVLHGRLEAKGKWPLTNYNPLNLELAIQKEGSVA